MNLAEKVEVWKDREGAYREMAEYNADHIHTTPDGRHFRHGDGVEVDGDGEPIESLIARTATQIAGAIIEDAEGTLAARIDAAIAWANRGTDCDLSQADRDALELLRGLLAGERYTLCDYDAGDSIRPATVEEVCECAVAMSADGGSGVIRVDGRCCHVE